MVRFQPPVPRTRGSHPEETTVILHPRTSGPSLRGYHRVPVHQRRYGPIPPRVLPPGDRHDHLPACQRKLLPPTGDPPLGGTEAPIHQSDDRVTPGSGTRAPAPGSSGWAEGSSVRRSRRRHPGLDPPTRIMIVPPSKEPSPAPDPQRSHLYLTRQRTMHSRVPGPPNGSSGRFIRAKIRGFAIASTNEE